MAQDTPNLSRANAFLQGVLKEFLEAQNTSQIKAWVLDLDLNAEDQHVADVLAKSLMGVGLLANNQEALIAFRATFREILDWAEYKRGPGVVADLLEDIKGL